MHSIINGQNLKREKHCSIINNKKNVENVVLRESQDLIKLTLRTLADINHY